MDPMKIAVGEAGGAGGSPLSGVRVLDLTTVISGPLCGQILGDLPFQATQHEWSQLGGKPAPRDAVG